MAVIHPTALIDPKADLDNTVEVGPYCIIGPKVKIGSGSRLMSHVRVEGPATVGADNLFFPFCYVGAIPQDLKYQGEESELIIGDRNRFRECVTLNRGTTGGGNITKIGNDCLVMANAHVGHDAIIGDNVILANSVAIAGHVTIHNGARVGGLCGITQFNVIGTLAYVGGCSLVHKDVAPFVSAMGNPVKPKGLNKVGLERDGYSEEVIQEISKAFKIIFLKNLTVEEAEKEINTTCNTGLSQIKELADFIKNSKNGIAR
jgi:UDP-N-acetylglucosamine acyltransferase